MPSKNRWGLNPRKWFGVKANVANKGEKTNNKFLSRAPPPSTATTTTRTIPSTSGNPRILSTKNLIKITPVSICNDANKNNTTVTQLQLPAFSVRRERTSTTLYRQTTFHPAHTEPTIRKNRRIEDKLSIDTTRWNLQSIPTIVDEPPKHEDSPRKQRDTSLLNNSHSCFMDYPRRSPNIAEEYSFPSRSSSSSSSSVRDDHDNSSSSGIFTDELLHAESKDTLSTLEVLSVESIADSQTSLNNFPTRPIIHHYRRPMSGFETIDDKPQSRRTSVIPSYRSHSAESILKDKHEISTPKSRQSSAAIIKKIEKRLPISRSPSDTLAKAGFVRIATDTYRLTGNQTTPLPYSRRSSINSFVPYSNYDDSLRSANNEECYATLPRTSSTEQLHNNIQNDLRIIVNECIRPMVTSIEKTRSTKNHQRYKRSQVHTQLNIDNITDKLLSSIDYSTYARYQRCN